MNQNKDYDNKINEDELGSLKLKISPRRVGDIAKSFASSEKARKILNWKAEKNLESMIQSAIKFAIQNV